MCIRDRFITYVAPYIIHATYGYYFNFWEWTFTPTTEISLFSRFKFGAIYRSAQAMINSQTGFFGAFLAIGTILWSVSRFQKHLLLVRSITVLLLFIIFQALLGLRQANVIGGTASATYYYGALFPVFFLLVLGIAFTKVKFVWAFFVALYLGFVSISWFQENSTALIILHNRIYSEAFNLPLDGAINAYKLRHK